MARQLRIDYPGLYGHITCRGVARRDIYFSDEDRKHFLGILGKAHERWSFFVHGYCLMSNHYHLEVQLPEGGLSHVLQWINTTYASYVNRSHQRTGHLFQGRFKSAVIEEERHLHELTRYVHLNPVRAGLVEHPADYQWSSYRVFLGLQKKPPWLTIGRTLDRFGSGREEQRQHYREYVETPDEVVQNPLRELQFGIILGSAQFTGQLRTKLEAAAPDPEVSQSAKMRPQPDLAMICTMVGQVFEIAQERLQLIRRHHNDARDAALFLARKLSGRPGKELAECFGGMSAAAVSIACNRTADKMKKDVEFHEKVTELEHELTLAARQAPS